MSEEKSKEKGGFKFFKDWSLLKKIKQVKHIGLIVTIIFVLILLIILFGNFDFLNFTKTSKTVSQSSGYAYTSSIEYAENLEHKLKTIIGKIKGAGNVDVMITLESGTNLLLANNETQNVGSDDVTIVSASPIILEQNGNSSPLVVGEVLPKIKGVVVVSSGASDIAVRLNILHAIQTLLNLSDMQIQILVGK